MREEQIILLAEDREDDILLIRRAFEKAGLGNRLQVVRDGEQAVAYLTGQAEYADRTRHPLPDLLLLDLKMPRMDGFEVLKWIREHQAFCLLRVIVLASSGQIRDINLAYELGANSFLVKPLEFDQFVEIATTLKCWVQTSKAPELRPLPAIPSTQAPPPDRLSSSPPPP